MSKWLIGLISALTLSGCVSYQCPIEGRFQEKSLSPFFPHCAEASDEIEKVNIPALLLFDHNKATLKNVHEKDLVKVIRDSRHKCQGSITIDGHASSPGSDYYNDVLSQKRANNVAAYLANHGVDESRLYTVAYGKRRPIASNKTQSGQAKNRRVEITLQDCGAEFVEE